MLGIPRVKGMPLDYAGDSPQRHLVIHSINGYLNSTEHTGVFSTAGRWHMAVDFHGPVLSDPLRFGLTLVVKAYQ